MMVAPPATSYSVGLSGQFETRKLRRRAVSLLSSDTTLAPNVDHLGGAGEQLVRHSSANDDLTNLNLW